MTQWSTRTTRPVLPRVQVGERPPPDKSGDRPFPALSTTAYAVWSAVNASLSAARS